MNAPQGSNEWKIERLGKVTASRVSDVVARTKSGWGASRANYMAQLIAERLTGEMQESFSNAAMQWGTEKEPEARATYTFYCGWDVTLIGFIAHPSIPMSGASPDGFVGTDGLVEFKCPNTATHIETLLSGGIDDKYMKQMQWQMACANRAWCDWVSFDPRMPENMRLHVERVPRNNTLIAALEKDVTEFLGELASKVSNLQAQFK